MQGLSFQCKSKDLVQKLSLCDMTEFLENIKMKNLLKRNIRYFYTLKGTPDYHRQRVTMTMTTISSKNRPCFPQVFCS